MLYLVCCEWEANQWKPFLFALSSPAELTTPPCVPKTSLASLLAPGMHGRACLFLVLDQYCPATFVILSFLKQ